MVKNPSASAGGMGLIPGWGKSLQKGMATCSLFLPGEPHGQRSLAGCSPWGRKRVSVLAITQQQQSWLQVPQWKISLGFCAIPIPFLKEVGP